MIQEDAQESASIDGGGRTRLRPSTNSSRATVSSEPTFTEERRGTMEKPETSFPSAIGGYRPIEQRDDPLRQIVSTLQTEEGRLLGEAFDLPADAKIFIHLCRRGEATASDLIALKLTPSTVYRALRTLRELDAIEEAGTVRRADPDEGGKPATKWRLAKRYGDARERSERGCARGREITC